MIKNDFHIGSAVTDGKVHGTITNIFNIKESDGSIVKCLDVKLIEYERKLYGDFSCTRADWWRLIENETESRH